MSKMISIITCNLNGIDTFNKLKNIAKKLKELQADIVLFQEVVQKPNNKSGLEIINTTLNYKYVNFEISHDFSKDYGKGILQKEQIFEGLGILTNKKFTRGRIDLPIIKGLDRWPRLAVKYVFENFSICNLHLSKHEESRKKEIKFLPNTDILAGDFNMFPKELSNFSSNNSFSFKKYVSYPSKKQTLDYVVIRKGKFTNLKIIENISDHNGVYVKIEL